MLVSRLASGSLHSVCSSSAVDSSWPMISWEHWLISATTAPRSCGVAGRKLNATGLVIAIPPVLHVASRCSQHCQQLFECARGLWAHKKAVGDHIRCRPRPDSSACAEAMAYTWAQYGEAKPRWALSNKPACAEASSRDVLSQSQ